VTTAEVLEEEDIVMAVAAVKLGAKEDFFE
jgi:hypothetical protein